MPAVSRHTILARLRARLEQRGYPRLQMALLVALTGGAGFLCSSAMLRSGVEQMWLRYLVSVAVAYFAFLVLLWLWLLISAQNYVDHHDLRELTAQRRDESWRDPERKRLGPSLTDALNVELELALPLLVLVVAAAVLAASFYIVYAAPVLLAELLLDGVLALTLYRRLRTLDRRHWLETAIRRTYATFLWTGVILVVAGLAMAHYVPGARSMGEVIVRLS
jgi:hypothetical protein